MDPETGDVSLGTIAASIGTACLLIIAAFGLYFDGVILLYVGYIQPGVPTLFAVAYISIVVAAPLLAGRRMRERDSGWRRTLAVCAFIVVAVSILFFPFATLALSM